VNAKFYPKNWSEADSLLKFYRKNQAWRKFFKIKEDYLDIRSLHALTCHKAQGSTYKEVFVDLDDIGINKKYYEVARLVYVAITRASDKVYLYGKLPDRWRQ
jgi:exodeoxyribonuclease-5